MVNARGQNLTREIQAANPSISLEDARKQAAAQVAREYFLDGSKAPQQ